MTLQLHTTFCFHYISPSLNSPVFPHSLTPSLHNKPAVPPIIMSHDHSTKRHRKTKVESQDDDDDVQGFTPWPATEERKGDKKKKKKKEDGSATVAQVSAMALGRRKLQAAAVARLRSVVAAFSRNRLQHISSGRVVGTLFGSKRGHVHFAFQKDPTSYPAFLIELDAPISGLAKEMASGLVRIALECDKVKDESKKRASSVQLLQEPVFRTYCNGKKCGFATRRECGDKEWRLLKAVEPISMGAGVLPGNETENDSDEVMYMRAKFERIVGSGDSEAFYMMNPDCNGAPELSVYLLRV